MAVYMTGNITSIAPNRLTKSGIKISDKPIPEAMPASMAVSICQVGSTMLVASHALAMPIVLLDSASPARK